MKMMKQFLINELHTGASMIQEERNIIETNKANAKRQIWVTFQKEVYINILPH